MPTELDFVAEYSRWENEVYRFILSLVPQRADADELMQETAKVLWTKYFETDEPIRSFKAWACQIAFYEVLRFRKTKARRQLSFSQEVVEQLASVRQEHEDVLLQRRGALAKCLQSIQQSDLELLRLRYGITGQETEVAEQESKPSITNAMSKRLQRIRRMLMKCIETKMAEAAT